MRNQELYIKDILSAINNIEDFIRRMDLKDFISDDKTSSAVIRKLEIIGEAVKQIPESIRIKNNKIPWKELAGMRDKLIHFYFGTDYNLVWNVIKERLPKLKIYFESIK